MDQLIQQMYGAWITFIHNKQIGYQPGKEEVILHNNLSRALQAHSRNIELIYLDINRRLEMQNESGDS